MSEQLGATQKALSGAAIALVLAGCAERAPDDERPQQSKTESTQAVPSKPHIGYDVSFWQKTKLPDDPLFAIVGLNGTLANNFNEYFPQQIAWAKTAPGTASQPPASIYVHIGNPSSKLAKKWPNEGENRYGVCRGDDSLACDYEYGVMLADADIAYAQESDADNMPVWLDVEPNYSWQKDTARNRAAMEGMVATFTAHGMPVGIYSNAAIWRKLAGEVPNDSELHGLPNWVLGAGTMKEAQANCNTEGFTGQVVLAQIADNIHVDRNVICEPMPATQS